MYRNMDCLVDMEQKFAMAADTSSHRITIERHGNNLTIDINVCKRVRIRILAYQDRFQHCL